MSNSIRDKFREDSKVTIPKQSLELSKPGKRGKGTVLGQEWDETLSEIINERRKRKLYFQQGSGELHEELTERPDYLLLEEIFNKLNINCLESKFPLYSYVYSKEETQPKEERWEGKADAIGWCQDRSSGEGRYVVVEWKVLNDIATFWQKSEDAYGQYLHQCLIYARMLKLHMKLNYLPYILLVPINGYTGKDFHPCLFTDYPDECIAKIDSFQWAVTKQEPPVQIPLDKPFKKENLKKGEIVDKKMLMSDLVAEDATVGDFMEVFGWPALKVRE